MGRILLLAVAAIMLIECTPKQSKAEAEADAATRSYIRTLVTSTNNLIEIGNEKNRKKFEIIQKNLSDPSLQASMEEPLAMPLIDTTSLLLGLDKLKGKELDERQKFVETYIESVKP